MTLKEQLRAYLAEHPGEWFSYGGLVDETRATIRGRPRSGHGSLSAACSRLPKVVESVTKILTGPLNVRAIPPEPLDILQPDGSTETRSVWSYWVRSTEDLAKIARAWDGDADVYFCPQTVEDGRSASRTTITHINVLALDLDFDIAGRALGEGEILERCRRLGLDAPAAIVATGGGFHVYWIYDRPLYTGPRRGESHQDRLARLADRADWHSEVAGRMVKLFADLGTDPKATDLPHIFRVPGFQSVKRGERVEVVHLDAQATTSLKALSDQSRQALANEKATVAVARPKPTEPRAQRGAGRPKAPTTAPGLLQTAGWHWLRGSHFTQGNRNPAYFALGVTLRMAGYEFADAWIELTQWRQTQTTPTYPKAEAQRALKAIYRHGYGLLKDRLSEIHDSAGRSMPEHAADGLIQAMPRTDRRRAERQNYPLIHHVGRILSYLLRNRITADTPISAMAMAKATGLSRNQVERVEGFFDTIGIRTIKRRGRSWVGHYNLRRLSIAPHGVIHKFEEWIGYVEDLKLKLWRWWRSLRTLMKRLMATLSALCKLFSGSSGCESRDDETAGDRGEPGSTDDRAPPAGGLSYPD